MSLAPGSAEHRRHFAAFAAAAYEPSRAIPEGYYLDPELSNRNRRVFVNPGTRQVVLAERGTVPKGKTALADLSTDLQLALNLHSYNSRFKLAVRNAKRAKDKYPDHHFTATGHSLGASVGQHVADKLNIDAVTYSAHLPTSQIHHEALRTLLGNRRKQRGVHNYSTVADPVGVGMILAGRSHVVKQSQRNPHALANFLV